MNKPKAVIIDLDGTLCNADHRLHHVQQDPKDWSGFFAKAHLDPPNEWCLDLVHALYKTNEYEILFLTGRSQREMTLDWLKQHCHIRHEHLDVNLYTRSPDDHRHDDVYKRECYLEKIAPQYKVMFAIDDRARIISMFRDLGIPSLQCSDWEEKDEKSGGQTAEQIRLHFEKTNK